MEKSKMTAKFYSENGSVLPTILFNEFESDAAAPTSEAKTVSVSAPSCRSSITEAERALNTNECDLVRTCLNNLLFTLPCEVLRMSVQDGKLATAVDKLTREE